MAPQLATGIVAVEIVLIGLQALFQRVFAYTLDPTGSLVVLVTIPVVLALVLWHSGPYTGGQRPR